MTVMNNTSRRRQHRQSRGSFPPPNGTRQGNERNLSLSNYRQMTGTSDGEDSPPPSPVFTTRRHPFSDVDSGYGSDLDDNSATRWARESYPSLPRSGRMLHPTPPRRRHCARRDAPPPIRRAPPTSPASGINTDFILTHQAPFNPIPEEEPRVNMEDISTPAHNQMTHPDHLNNNNGNNHKLFTYYISFEPTAIKKGGKPQTLLDTNRRTNKKINKGCRLAASHDFPKREE